MTTYVAFLRGINVGGRKPMKMEELKAAFASLGFRNVRTFLASGNVLFEAPHTSVSVLTGRIEERLRKAFRSEIGVLVRTIRELEQLNEANPFKEVRVTPQTRLYVTFLSAKPKSGLKITHRLPEKDFKIVRVSKGEVCSVLTLSANSRTTDLMNTLEKEFGQNITTRNWNTITRILKSHKP